MLIRRGSGAGISEDDGLLPDSTVDRSEASSCGWDVSGRVLSVGTFGILV